MTRTAPAPHALLPAIALLLTAAAGPARAIDKTTNAACTPLETRGANASWQKPAFPGQTRACRATTTEQFDVTVVAGGLEYPWALEPLPDGGLIVTERPGRIRIIAADGRVGEPLAGVPPVHAEGQGGLLDVALSPQFSTDRTIFWSFSEPRDDGNGTSIARGVLSADGRSLEQVRVILRTRPSYDNDMHYGSRLVFAPDGKLFVTMGERSDKRTRPQAQELGSHFGKILRVTADGSAPPDNPFVAREGALPEIWSLGHRNIQSAALDERGRLWAIEHGPRGGDELNRIEPGKNYGWPIVTYGEEYYGLAIGDSITHREGYEDAVYYWDPVIAPSGAQFYSGKAFAQWRGNLFIGGLVDNELVRLVLENDRVVGEEHLLKDRRKRIRDVREGNAGELYVVTDEAKGEVWRLTPRR